MNSMINRPRVNRNSQRRLAAMISREMANVIPQAIQQIQAVPAPDAAFNHLRNFTAGNPPKFVGNGGAAALLQWIEKVESIFTITEIPIHLHVKCATSSFSGRALSWWNQEKRTRGMVEVLRMTWVNFKEIMIEEFCLPSELKKLDEEFWTLKQIGGDNAEYTTRFHELSLLDPRFVISCSESIYKYISGLPVNVQDSVRSCNPATIVEAMRLAAIITDDQVKDGLLIRSSVRKVCNKRKKEKVSQNESENTGKSTKKKKKTGNPKVYVAVGSSKPSTNTAPNQPTPSNVATSKKSYNGLLPLCTTCSYHHIAGQPCKMCTKCNKFGHLAQYCRCPVEYGHVYVLDVKPIRSIRIDDDV